MKQHILAAAIGLIGTTAWADFQTVEQKNPSTHTRDATVWTFSDEELSCNQGRPASLQFSCLNGAMMFYISTGCDMPAERGDASVGVLVQYGDAEPDFTYFGLGANNDGFGLWRRSNAVGMAQRLFESRSLRIGFQPRRSGPVYAKFDLSGLRKAMTSVETDCGWEDFDES